MGGLFLFSRHLSDKKRVTKRPVVSPLNILHWVVNFTAALHRQPAIALKDDVLHRVQWSPDHGFFYVLDEWTKAFSVRDHKSSKYVVDEPAVMLEVILGGSILLVAQTDVCQASQLVAPDTSSTFVRLDMAVNALTDSQLPFAIWHMACWQLAAAIGLFLAGRASVLSDDECAETDEVTGWALDVLRYVQGSALIVLNDSQQSQLLSHCKNLVAIFRCKWEEILAFSTSSAFQFASSWLSSPLHDICSVLFLLRRVVAAVDHNRQHKKPLSGSRAFAQALVALEQDVSTSQHVYHIDLPAQTITRSQSVNNPIAHGRSSSSSISIKKRIAPTLQVSAAKRPHPPEVDGAETEDELDGM